MSHTPLPMDPLAPSAFDGREPVETPGGSDDSGRKRFAWNVVASWAGHMIFVVAGFLMPRLIDRSLGQESLGVWDFCWLTVSYFTNLQLGIGMSVNRHVARHKATGDTEALREAVSSVTAVDIAIGLVILTAAWVTAAILPNVAGQRLGGHVEAARWVVALLGTTLAVQASTDAFRGVISGLHRWDIHNALNSGFYAATVGGMVLSLYAGHGLRGLAVTYMVGHIGAEAARVVVAHRICPDLRVRWRYVRYATARHMVIFGGKAFLDGLSRLLLVQGNSLVVATFLGPAALAVFSRPSSLVRQAEGFLFKFAHVFTPTASSLQGQGRSRDLRDLLIVGGRFATALALPLLGFMAILADPILEMWMGSRYEHGVVLAVMSAGAFLPLTQYPTAMILIGLNLHGRAAAINTIFAVAGIAFSLLSIGYLGFGLVGAALTVAVPMSASSIVNGFYSCKRLHIPVANYLSKVYVVPALCATPYVLALIAIRIVFKAVPLVEIALGALAVILILVPVYWAYLLTPDNRKTLRNAMRRVVQSLGLA